LDSVWVGPFLYNITWREGFIYEDGNLGCCNEAKQEIEVSTTSCKAKQLRTLLHEMVEGYNTTYDMNLTHHQINQLEVMLYEFIAYNQVLTKEIQTCEDTELDKTGV
jgi:hypothetical protein